MTCAVTPPVFRDSPLSTETDVPDNTPPRPKFILTDTRLATTLQTNSVFSRLPKVSYGADFLSGSVMCKLLERLIVIKHHIAILICDDNIPSFEALPVTGSCNRAIDLVFVLDSSESINNANPRNWQQLLAFVNKIVSMHTIGSSDTRVGVVRYSTDVVNWIYLDSYNNKDELMKAIARIPYDGKSTNIAGGILQMRSVQFTAAHGDRPEVPNVAIVVTDGVSIITPECTIPEAEHAHKQGITMFSIGVTSKVDSAEVFGISSPPHTPNTYVFFAQDFGNVDNIATTIFNATCNVRPPPGSAVSPTPAPPCEYVNIHY